MIKRLLLLSTISCLLLISCSDDPSSFTDEPPELPPAASMDIDMSTLTENTQAKDITTEASDYFVQAVFRAGFLKKIIDTHLLIPKNLLEAAEDTVAQLNEEQQWEWNYQYSANTNSFDVRLIAERISSSAVNWSFLVTAAHLDLEDHLVFGGTTQNEGAQGVWTYYGFKDSEEDDQKLSEIDWDIQGDSTQIRLDVLSDLSVATGSYIDYSFDGELKTIEFYNAESDETTIIQWNVDTKAGYIIAPDVNNGEKACWNEEQENVPCSE